MQDKLIRDISILIQSYKGVVSGVALKRRYVKDPCQDSYLEGSIDTFGTVIKDLENLISNK